MDIAFRDRKLLKCANEHRTAVKTLGPERADRFRKRLTELRAATCLEDLRHLPQAKFHELKANRAGQIACNLDHPYRLIMVPAHDPPPLNADGGLDWNLITAVKVIDIVDYHE